MKKTVYLVKCWGKDGVTTYWRGDTSKYLQNPMRSELNAFAAQYGFKTVHEAVVAPISYWLDDKVEKVTVVPMTIGA